MPSVQRGSVKRRGNVWRARYYDDQNRERSKSGFPTKEEALAWLTPKVEEALAVRRGCLTPTRDRPQTVDALLDLFLEKHGRTVDPATTRKLTAQLRKARDEFGDRQPASLRRLELEDWRASLPAGSRSDVFRAFRRRSPGASSADWSIGTRP
jgi:hypothetical protein